MGKNFAGDISLQPVHGSLRTNVIFGVTQLSIGRKPMSRFVFHSFRESAVLILVMVSALVARGEDITGVQPAALDQPRIYMHLYRKAGEAALSVKVDKESSGAIEAFLDTGASGIVLSSATVKGLKIHAERTTDNSAVTYEDVGVAGSEKFRVSEPLLAAFAPYSSNTDGQNDGAYGKPIGPLRVQVRTSEGLLDSLTGGLDVAGMPAMAGKVVVIDAKPVNTFADKLKTSIHEQNDPAIPKTDRQIPLTYVSFQPFTRVTPPDSEGPTLAKNPMIGPNPFAPGDKSRPVLIRHHGRTASITMLLDTGAVTSIISTKTAEKLGVKYSADGSSLEGVPGEQQFDLTVGGIGGNKSSVGFYADLLALPTRQGAPLTYARAPFLVSDITVVDPTTKKQFTLEGVFGMNFLVATANVTGGLLPDLDKLTQGPFSTIVIDHGRGYLGVK